MCLLRACCVAAPRTTSLAKNPSVTCTYSLPASHASHALPSALSRHLAARNLSSGCVSHPSSSSIPNRQGPPQSIHSLPTLSASVDLACPGPLESFAAFNYAPFLPTLWPVLSYVLLPLASHSSHFASLGRTISRIPSRLAAYSTLLPLLRVNVQLLTSLAFAPYQALLVLVNSSSPHELQHAGRLSPLLPRPTDSGFCFTLLVVYHGTEWSTTSKYHILDAISGFLVHGGSDGNVATHAIPTIQCCHHVHDAQPT